MKPVDSAGSKGVTAQDYNSYWKSGEIRRLTYDKGVGLTNNKDLSNYGVMSEKRGEYKVDKQTGEWIYEPYETVVDTSKYDVISGTQSQRIRSNKVDNNINTGSVSTKDDYTTYVQENTSEFVDWLSKLDSNIAETLVNKEIGSSEFTEAWKEAADKYGEEFDKKQLEFYRQKLNETATDQTQKAEKNKEITKEELDSFGTGGGL